MKNLRSIKIYASHFLPILFWLTCLFLISSRQKTL